MGDVSTLPQQAQLLTDTYTEMQWASGAFCFCLAGAAGVGALTASLDRAVADPIILVAVLPTIWALRRWWVRRRLYREVFRVYAPGLGLGRVWRVGPVNQLRRLGFTLEQTPTTRPLVRAARLLPPGVATAVLVVAYAVRLVALNH
jgi:hypothetical protein